MVITKDDEPQEREQQLRFGLLRKEYFRRRDRETEGFQLRSHLNDILIAPNQNGDITGLQIRRT